jgi:hypothetical protein
MSARPCKTRRGDPPPVSLVKQSRSLGAHGRCPLTMSSQRKTSLTVTALTLNDVGKHRGWSLKDRCLPRWPAAVASRPRRMQTRASRASSARPPSCSSPDWRPGERREARMPLARRRLGPAARRRCERGAAHRAGQPCAGGGRDRMWDKEVRLAGRQRLTTSACSARTPRSSPCASAGVSSSINLAVGQWLLLPEHAHERGRGGSSPAQSAAAQSRGARLRPGSGR